MNSDNGNEEAGGAGFSRLGYIRRVFDNYVLGRSSHLDFWHGDPKAHPGAAFDQLGPYYMMFDGKVAYRGPFEDGVPKLDYGGQVGCHYNPIAVAQYGLGHWNRWLETEEKNHLQTLIRQADWLVTNLEKNEEGVPVWTHPFEWEYREGLEKGWPSGLAQGQAISCLLRAWEATDDEVYLETAQEGFEALNTDVDDGGLTRMLPNGEAWIEEIIVEPPSSILNGFIWGLWGVWDLYLATDSPEARQLFERCHETLVENLQRYDTGWWSLYELSPFRIPMVASPFYHDLHITQLNVMASMTGSSAYEDYAERWAKYRDSSWNRVRMLATKASFKLLHY